MKNKRAIFFLFAANTVSGIAQGISMLAIPWYFADTLGDRTAFGKLFAVVTFVSIFWGVYSGVLVDKYNRKKLFLAENMVGALFLLLAATYGIVQGTIPTLLVCLVFALTVFIYNIHYPTLYAFAQELVEPKDYKKITSYIEVQGQLSSVAAGGAAAILLSGVDGKKNILGLFDIYMNVEAWPLSRIFLVDGLSYLLAIGLISLIVFQSTEVRKVEIGSGLTRLKLGIKFLKANPLIFAFGVAGSFLFLTILIMNFFIVPGYIKEFLDDSGATYGIGEIGWAAGSALAGFFIRFLFTKRSEVFVVVLLTSLGAAAYFALTQFHYTYLFYVLMLVMGFANAGSRILRVSFLLRLVPNQLIGRANSVTRFVSTSLRFATLAILIIPFFVDRILLSIGILGSICTFAALMMIYLYKRLEKLKPEDIVAVD